MFYEKPHLPTDSDRGRHPQTNRGWSFGTLTEEKNERLGPLQGKKLQRKTKRIN